MQYLSHCFNGGNSLCLDSHITLKYVPVSCWIIVGIDDKYKSTSVFTVTLDGQFLPMQLIYQGSTKACRPHVKFHSDLHITSSPNHWANELTTKDYIKNILNPYLMQKWAQLSLAVITCTPCILYF